LIESAAHLGGAGINTGTVPSKTLRETALYFSGLRQRELYGINYALKEGLSIEDFMFRKQIVIENEWAIIQRNLDRQHVNVIKGVAKLIDPHTVQVQQADDTVLELQTDIILIASGSSPVHPPDINFDDHLVYDSDTILHMQRMPQSIVVIGGGVIGCEYASMFTALGKQVTLVQGRGRFLPFLDNEIANRLQQQLVLLGLNFISNNRMAKLQTHENHVEITLSNGEKISSDIALIAAGRQGNVQNLGLEEIGVAINERKQIIVNEKYQTTIPNIYAAGDVIGFPALASTSMEQARVAMVNAFNLQYKEKVANLLPLAIYTIPEISMVGLTEEECQAQGIHYLVGRAYYERSARGQIIGDLSGMVKLIFAAADKKLLGVHLIGEMASELVHIGMHVMAVNGTIDAFINAVYNYPTLADSYKYAAYDGLDKWHRFHTLSK
jgi:NAD(P) transhydrogenase